MAKANHTVNTTFLMPNQKHNIPTKIDNIGGRSFEKNSTQINSSHLNEDYAMTNATPQPLANIKYNGGGGSSSRPVTTLGVPRKQKGKVLSSGLDSQMRAKSQKKQQTFNRSQAQIGRNIRGRNTSQHQRNLTTGLHHDFRADRNQI